LLHKTMPLDNGKVSFEPTRAELAAMSRLR